MPLLNMEVSQLEMAKGPQKPQNFRSHFFEIAKQPTTPTDSLTPSGFHDGSLPATYAELNPQIITFNHGPAATSQELWLSFCYKR